MNLSEAFQKLNLLESEDFNISTEKDSADLKNFLDTDELSDDVDIVDAQADTEDDIEDSYIGKVVTECNICHSKFYKDPEEIIIDNETGNCNVDEECPICFSQDGYKVIGKIVPFDEEETDTDSDDDLDVDSDVDDDIDIDSEVDSDDEMEESFHKRMLENRRRFRKKFKEGIIGALAGGAVGATVGHPLIGAAVGSAIGDSLSDDKDECLQEDIQSATIETDDTRMLMDADDSGRLTVTTEPLNAPMGEGETIAPLDMDDAIGLSEIQDENNPDIDVDAEDEEEPEDMDMEDIPEDETVDVDVEDFDEDSFDDLGESYLRRVYENVNSYKTTKVKSKGNKLMVEGVIEFNSGKTKPTSFIFESYKATKSGKLKFIGENTQITRGRRAFTVTGNVKDKKFLSESLNYNYTQKDSKGKSTRLYGTVKGKKSEV